MDTFNLVPQEGGEKKSFQHLAKAADEIHHERRRIHKDVNRPEEEAAGMASD